MAFFNTPALAQSASAPNELPPVVVTAPAKVRNPKANGPARSQSSPAAAQAASAQPQAKAKSDPAFRFGSYMPALDIGDLKLPPGTTLTTAGPVDGYRALTAFSATKTATPIGEIPQSIQVVPRSVIDQQGSLNLSEAIQNVSAVAGTSQMRTPGYDFPTIRGFQAEQWVDGLSVLYDVGARDALANIERVEVLKGPSAILYGGGNGAPVGGAINVVSKMPTNTAAGEVGFTFGGESYLRPYFDVNQPLAANGTVLFRMTGEYISTDSFIETLDAERYSLNPTLTLTNKTDTTLTVQGRITNWQQQEYQGLPATGTIAGDFRIDPHLFAGPDNMPDAYSRIHGVTVSLDHKIDEAVSVHGQARWSKAEFFEPVQIFLGSDGLQANTPALPPSTWVLSNGVLSQEFEEATGTANIEAKFQAGPTRNVVLLGGDYSRITDSGFIGFDVALGGAGFVDFSNPSFPTPYVEPPQTPATAIASGEKTYINAGVFAQIQSTVGDRLHLLGGLRLADVEISSVENFTGARDQVQEVKLLPRLGAVLDLTPGLSIYASYGQGLKGAPLLSNPGAPDPEFSEQREAGVKLDLATGLAATVAVFRLDRTNVPIPTGFSISGTQDEESRGVDTDLTWQPTPNWRIIGSFAFIDGEVTASKNATPVGNKLIAVPETSGRLWVNYSFDPDVLKGWSVGAGVYAASPQAIEFSNTYFTDSYFTVDARIGYDSPTFSAALTIKNLSDEAYFVPYDFFRGRVAPGDPRTLYGTVAYRF